LYKDNKKQRELGPIEVAVGGSIDLEKAIKILKSKMNKEGVLKAVRLKRYAEKPSDKKRRKRKEAAKKRAAAAAKLRRGYKKRYNNNRSSNQSNNS
jgi:small subunit ribosomal protein S21